MSKPMHFEGKTQKTNATTESGTRRATKAFASGIPPPVTRTSTLDKKYHIALGKYLQCLFSNEKLNM